MESAYATIRSLGLPDGEAIVQRAREYEAWTMQVNREYTLAVAYALGLHRDPNRSSTHVFVQRVEHVPTARDPRHKFRVAQAGVYRWADAGRAIERDLGYMRGRGVTCLRESYEERKATGGPNSTNIPIIIYSFGAGITPGVLAGKFFVLCRERRSR